MHLLPVVRTCSEVAKTVSVGIWTRQEFSSNPNQKHLNKLIKVFMITRKSQAGGRFIKQVYQTSQAHFS